jgi:hypothetical protein
MADAPLTENAGAAGSQAQDHRYAYQNTATRYEDQVVPARRQGASHDLEGKIRRYEQEMATLQGGAKTLTEADGQTANSPEKDQRLAGSTKLVEVFGPERFTQLQDARWQERDAAVASILGEVRELYLKPDGTAAFNQLLVQFAFHEKNHAVLIKHVEIVQKLISLDSTLEEGQVQMKFDQQEKVIALLLDKYMDMRFS